MEEYLYDLNATQAAIRAGYSAKRAEFTGSDLVRNRKVADAIQETMGQRLLKKVEMQAAIQKEMNSPTLVSKC